LDRTRRNGVHVDARRTRHHGREEADETGSFSHSAAVEQDVQTPGRDLAGEAWRAREGDCHLLWCGPGQLQT
jgi:hypothetical protein